MIDSEIIDHAIKFTTLRKTARDRLVERISLAYLWSDELLTSARVLYFFESSQTEDLKTAIRFFWSVRRQKLSEDQIKKILEFWNKCVAWANSLNIKPAKFLSELSLLSCYVNTITDYEYNLLIAVAPYIGDEYNGDIFIKQIIRLTEQDQDIEKICQILDLVFESFKPDIDYEDRLSGLMSVLAKRGKIDKALIYTDKLRYLDGFSRLFESLQTSGH